jgi:hypothetical protein
MNNFQPISQLPVAGALSGNEVVPIVQNGQTCQVSVFNLPTGFQGYTLVAPLTGFNLQIGNVGSFIIAPAGTLASGALVFPAAPFDGQILRIKSTQQVTSLSMSAGANTIESPLTAIGPGGFASWQYAKAQATWYRIG